MKRKICNSLRQGFTEHLIENLLIQAGYTVYPFGQELLIPYFKDYTSNNHKSNLYYKLKTMPDLLVFDNSNDVKLVEVKFRSDFDYFVEKELLYWKRNELSYFRYWKETILVVVCPESYPFIRVCDLEKFEGKNSFIDFFRFIEFRDKNVKNELEINIKSLFQKESIEDLFNIAFEEDIPDDYYEILGAESYDPPDY